MTASPDIREKLATDRNDHKKPELYGVGGWLLFFWIILVFISPLHAVVSLNGEFTAYEMSTPGLEAIPLWVHIKTCYWIILTCSLLLLWIAGYRLVNRLEWKSVRLTILALWLAGPGSVLANALYFYLMIPSFFDLLVKGILTDFFMSLPFPLIWTSYLLISKRVRNTYVKTVMKPPVL